MAPSSSSRPVFRAFAVGVASLALFFQAVAAATWCVAKSYVSQQELQTALDYACGAGADCLPIQSSGLCFLPNTIEAHASYAFNSFYQRKQMAPGSCDFAGTATVAATDPSYGSCVYPSSSSNAGGMAGGVPTTTTNTPITTPTSTPMTPTTGTPTTSTPTGTPIIGGGTGGTGVGGFTPLGPTVPNSDNFDNSMANVPSFVLVPLSLIWVIPLLFPHI